ncbi:MAG: ORF6N domain-containing protein [Flavobacteriales bacterium]|nr:ORF6N domain-containing protein [Flavobacteriales bacterium]
MNLEKIQSKIFTIRNQNIMFDFDLATLYQVETRSLKQAVRRNLDRFPEDFMFELTKKEWEELITNCDNLPENIKYSPSRPFVFTEQGVAMLSSVLRSKVAIEINISIMRAFVYIRQYALTYRDLSEKLNQLESKYNQQFKDISEAINFLLNKEILDTEQKLRKKIGYK